MSVELVHLASICQHPNIPFPHLPFAFQTLGTLGNPTSLVLPLMSQKGESPEAMTSPAEEDDYETIRVK